MFGLNAIELIILIGIVVLFFGPKKIPQITRGLGESVRYIKNGFSGGEKKG